MPEAAHEGQSQISTTRWGDVLLNWADEASIMSRGNRRRTLVPDN